MNKFLQIPSHIRMVATSYMDKLNIKYRKLSEFDDFDIIPKDLPGIITFANNTYHSDEYVTYLVDGDADAIRSKLEDAAINNYLRKLA